MKSLNKSLADTAYLNLFYGNKLNVFLKNTWISPEKIRLIKFKFKKAIIYCDENEAIYKIKVFKKKNPKNSQYNLEVFDLEQLNTAGGSLRYYICRKGKKSISLNATACVATNTNATQIFQAFIVSILMKWCILAL